MKYNILSILSYTFVKNNMGILTILKSHRTLDDVTTDRDFDRRSRYGFLTKVYTVLRVSWFYSVGLR